MPFHVKIVDTYGRMESAATNTITTWVTLLNITATYSLYAHVAIKHATARRLNKPIACAGMSSPRITPDEKQTGQDSVVSVTTSMIVVGVTPLIGVTIDYGRRRRMPKTTIEWTDFSHNFWVGCQKISAACDHCYAESWAKRSGHPELWDGERRRTKTWGDISKWNRAAKVAGIRYSVFSNSLSDYFDNQVPPPWRTDAWEEIRVCDNLDFLLLTKRPQNIPKMLPPDWGAGWPNVRLGTTVESPDEYRRIRFLQAVPCALRFLSMEPLLARCDDIPLDGISWVITGGESGGNARPSHPDWFRSVRDQCAERGVAYLHKQNGEFAPGEIAGDFLDPEKPAKGMSWTGSLEGWIEKWSEPDGYIDDEPDVYRVGKKHAGRMLDGVTHNSFPEQHS